MSEEIGRRKLSHIEVCLHQDVGYTSRSAGFERVELPYRALPELDLDAVAPGTALWGRELRAPLLIGAMTGGAQRARTINTNLATAAQRLGIGMMLGSQRVMLGDETATASFLVREQAPDVLLVGNLGLAQLRQGYGAEQAAEAVHRVGADAMAIHTNPLQEAVQPGGDTGFAGLAAHLSELVAGVDFPVLVKEVGHGISGAVAGELAGLGVAGIDVAGAGGTSWCKVEQLAAHGHVWSPELAEWGIPTVDALCQARRAAPGVVLVASGGVRSGMDVAKALALGADAVAIAHPLLAPATESADAVVAVLARILHELRIAMYCAGCATPADLRALGVPDP